MSKEYKIAWHAFINEESIIEGRSLVEAETYEEATHKLMADKVREYRLRPNSVIIDALIEIVQ